MLCVRAWARTRRCQALASNIKDDAVCIHMLAALGAFIALGDTSATVQRTTASDLHRINQQLLANQALYRTNAGA